MNLIMLHEIFVQLEIMALDKYNLQKNNSSHRIFTYSLLVDYRCLYAEERTLS